MRERMGHGPTENSRPRYHHKVWELYVWVRGTVVPVAVIGKVQSYLTSENMKEVQVF